MKVHAQPKSIACPGVRTARTTDVTFASSIARWISPIAFGDMGIIDFSAAREEKWWPEPPGATALARSRSFASAVVF